jgi:mono/diheme cytochrome c family protein
LATLAAVSGCATAPPAARKAPILDASADRGRFLVLRSCAGCHAVGSLGESPNGSAPSFPAVRLRYNTLSLERRLAEISKNGHVEMPPIYMSDAEIKDIVAYIETIEPSDSAAEPARPREAGRRSADAASRLILAAKQEISDVARNVL